MPSAPNLSGLFPEAENSGPWPGWKWVKLGVIILAALLFLLFMIYPLLKRSGFSLKAGTIRAAVVRWFADLGKGLSAFFQAFRERGSQFKMKKIDREKLRRIASELFAGGVTRKEIKRSVSYFARLILWGIESAGVPWKPSLAPGEYCGLLSAALDNFPEKREPVIQCGELFEKALYSGRPLQTEEERDFKNMVQSITGDML
jgi:hypothetical protein